MLMEGIEIMLASDVESGTAVPRNYIKATVDSQRLSGESG